MSAPALRQRAAQGPANGSVQRSERSIQARATASRNKTPLGTDSRATNGVLQTFLRYVRFGADSIAKLLQSSDCLGPFRFGSRDASGSWQVDVRHMARRGGDRSPACRHP